MVRGTPQSYGHRPPSWHRHRRPGVCDDRGMRLLWVLFVLATAVAAVYVWASAVAAAWRDRDRQLAWLIALVVTLPLPVLALAVAIAHHVTRRRTGPR